MKEERIWNLLRYIMALIFLWAFFDKLFGLGFSTTPEKAWLLGNSPTAGFLKGTAGFFSPFFQNLVGVNLVDWLFMLGLLLIGLSLLFGIGMKVAGYSGALLMFFMWLAVIPPKSNPVIDDHIVYMIIFLRFSALKINSELSKWWRNTKIVKEYPFLA